MNKPSRWIPAAALVVTAAVVAAVAAATNPPNLVRALEEQQRLLAEDPGDAGAINDYGNLLQLAGRLEEAEAAYRRALELAPERVSPRFNLGLLLQRRGRVKSALAEYRSVLDLDPSHAWTRYQIGAIYEAQGDERRAVRWYGEAFALEPRLAFAEYNPAVIENRLVEEAMLTGYRAEAARPLAPHVFEQPGRIRDLMLPGVPMEAEDERPGEETAEEPADETAGEAPRRLSADTLDTGDLDDRSVNQATPQGSSRSRFRPPSTRSRTRTAPEPRTWTRPDPEERPSERSPRRQGGSVIVQPDTADQTGDQTGGSGDQPTLQRAPTPAPRTVTPGNRPTFRPGVRSTGRLELELVPHQPSATTTERAG